MKKFFLIALSLVSALQLSAQFKTGHYSTLNDSETVAAMRSHVRFLSSSALEGRAAGSEGEKDAALYLTEELSKAGIDVLSDPKKGDLFGLRQESGDTLVSRNVVAFINGSDKNLSNHYIVIGARMDNQGVGGITIDGVRRERIFYGANGNASGMAMLIELAKRLSTNALSLRRSVIIMGFGASTRDYAGAWYFLNRAFSDVAHIDAMVNLDMLGTSSRGFYAFSASNPDMNAIATALEQTLQPIKPVVTSEMIYPSDNIAFYDKEIPSMTFSTGRYSEHNTEKDTEAILNFEDMERELEYIYNYTVSLANGPKPIFSAASEVKKRGNSSDGVFPYYDCDRKPTFLGNSDPRVFLEKWVYKYVKYPEAALRNGIQGRVLVDFVIDEKGKVRDVKVLRSADEDLDAEAVRVISASPDWKPGYVKGNKVKSEISLWVEFRLEKKKNK